MSLRMKGNYFQPKQFPRLEKSEAVGSLGYHRCYHQNASEGSFFFLSFKCLRKAQHLLKGAKLGEWAANAQRPKRHNGFQVMVLKSNSWGKGCTSWTFFFPAWLVVR